MSQIVTQLAEQKVIEMQEYSNLCATYGDACIRMQLLEQELINLQKEKQKLEELLLKKRTAL